MAELVDTNSASAKASDILQGKTAYVKSGLVEGTIPTQDGSVVIPGTASKTAVERGVYMGGDIVMAGDANLKPENIAKGVTIFGVKGTWEGDPPPPTLPEGFYEINVQSSNPEGGIASGGGVASLGTTITVDAELVDKRFKRFKFTEWRENDEIVTDSNSYTINVDRPHNLIAVFDGPKYSATGLYWESSQYPYTGTFGEIVYDGKNFVMLTDSTKGNYLYSENGKSWRWGTFPISYTFRSLSTYNGDTIAIPNSGKDIARKRSPSDGYSICNVISSGQSGTASIVMYAGTITNNMIAIVSGGNGIYTRHASRAYDNTFFTRKSENFTDSYNKVVGDNYTIVLYQKGYNRILVATETSVWNTVVLPRSINEIAVAHYGVDATYVAVRNGDTALCSKDKSTWDQYKMPYDANWVSISVIDQTGFLALSENGKIAYSNDGMVWDGYELPESDILWEHIAGKNGSFVAVSKNKILHSDNLTNWYESDPIYSIDDYALRCVAFGDGKFVSPEYGSNKVFYSEDGVHWKHSTIGTTSQNWSSITYGNNKFVTVASNSNIMAYSNDGVNWEISTLPSSSYWSSVTYGSNRFVAISSSVSVSSYSDNGIDWELSTNKPAANGTTVAYGNGVFVSITNGAFASYSYDGIVWENVSIPNGQWYSLAFGNGKFISLNYGSATAIYSEDGIVWETTILPTSANWRGIAYGNDKFIGIAQNSATVIFSIDGIEWEVTQLPSASNWWGVAYGNNKFLSVASPGTTSAYST